MKIIDKNGNEIETSLSKRIETLEERIADLTRAINLLVAAHDQQAVLNQRQLVFNGQVLTALNADTMQ